ncbi:hypothetical protein [uncultured Shewanella sp.]|uniref:hypothetical protein n=1 Tax=uncultured Shewanella sp. TaxID=173975 RepID=UPI00260F8605|nr:hypothetical protein [uncultured Shewanella sp.]
MAFPLIGWAAIAVGGAIVAYAMSSDDDSSQSSGESTYKKSIKLEIEKRDKTRTEAIKNCLALATMNLWKQKIRELQENNTAILFSKDNTGLITTEFSRELLANNYSVFILNEAKIKEMVQTIRSYISIDGNTADLEVQDNDFHLVIDQTLVKYTEGPLTQKDFNMVALHLGIVDSNDVENNILFNLLNPLVKLYKVQSYHQNIDVLLAKYNAFYGEREGLESDNNYNSSIDSALMKIKTDLA